MKNFEEFCTKFVQLVGNKEGAVSPALITSASFAYGDADNATEYVFLQGDFPVYNNDLNLLINNWRKTVSEGADPCADFDHAGESVFFTFDFAVYNNDLNILVTYWKMPVEELEDCPTYIP